jgi:hypothetical protein
MTLHYPNNPNEKIKKVYYQFFHNLSYFLPNKSFASNFDKLLEEYPLTPYLDSRDKLIKWVHFIHNKINERLEKPTISLEEFYIQYYDKYKESSIFWYNKEKIMYIMCIFLLLCVIYYLYEK